jgi:hypothetical protein
LGGVFSTILLLSLRAEGPRGVARAPEEDVGHISYFSHFNDDFGALYSTLVGLPLL